MSDSNAVNIQSLPYTITVHGRGEFGVQPDLCLVNLGVMTEAESSNQAIKDNSAVMNNVTEELVRFGIPKKDMVTTTYTVYPIYDYKENGNVLRGFRVTHLIQVTIGDIKKVGVYLDVATAAGANQVENIQFTYSNEAWAVQEALKLALANAKEKAQALAQSEGAQIQPIPLKIMEEEANVFRPVQLAMKLEAAQASNTTPIQTGQIKIAAHLTAIYNLF